jgi:hypothetical protein
MKEVSLARELNLISIRLMNDLKSIAACRLRLSG